MDAQAKVLLAAIGYTFGTRLVTLGLYSNNDVLNTVGDPLSGGHGSTSQKIPDDGECQLARVTLAGEGVTLTAQTKYWLVAGPDNVNASDFEGTWQMSNFARYASIAPPAAWHNFSGAWPAAQIRGRRIQAFGLTDAGNFNITQGLIRMAGVGKIVRRDKVPPLPAHVTE
jgi:hypothetical protein